MEKPLISIIIPVYNVKEQLTECVNSILEQSYEQYELILVDDGSTDGSSELCDQLAKISSKIQRLFFRKKLIKTQKFQQITK